MKLKAENYTEKDLQFYPHQNFYLIKFVKDLIGRRKPKRYWNQVPEKEMLRITLREKIKRILY